MRTGETYDSKESALAAGVPESDIAEVIRGDKGIPEVRFSTGPFKGRVYKRHPQTGQLIRVSELPRDGFVTKTDSNGADIRVRAR